MAPRRFPAVPRATKRFERRYQGRTSAERVNARLKVLWGADDGSVKDSRRFVAQVGVVLPVHGAFATLLASAPRSEGALGSAARSRLRSAARAGESGRGHELRSRFGLTTTVARIAVRAERGFRPLKAVKRTDSGPQNTDHVARSEACDGAGIHRGPGRRNGCLHGRSFNYWTVISHSPSVPFPHGMLGNSAAHGRAALLEARSRKESP